MLSVLTRPIMLSVIMLSVIMLSVIMLRVIMLSVIMLSVVAPSKQTCFFLSKFKIMKENKLDQKKVFRENFQRHLLQNLGY